MERTGALIERLMQQYSERVGADKLLATVQLIAAELQQQTVTEAQTPKKISVIMPAYHRREAPVDEVADVPKPVPVPPAPAPVAVAQPVTQPAAPPKLQPPLEHKVMAEVPKPAVKQPWQYDVVKETPTLAQQQPSVAELNEIIGARQESLNERLKTGSVELGAVLQSSPVRDLKKAIGINDRYVFLNELFRGDEAMYERSIKTINTFTILAEAEYWIKRELKLKLAWDEQSETVIHFDQLVKRRFS